MRRKTLLLLFLLPFLKSWSQNPATIFTIPNRHIVLPCGTSCTAISAIVPHIKQSDDYVVTPMSYLPFAYSTATGTDVTTKITAGFFDDQWTSKIPISFPFCFYGITYPTLLIGTNSNITFDTSRASTNSGYAISSTTGAIPNTTYAPASIFGPYHDIDIDNPGLASTKIEYRVEGVAPTRRFITSYKDIPYFSASCSGLYATHQMVLYENTGVIEVYIQDKPNCVAWNSGLAILGIQDQTRTKAVAAPGKNATVWGTTGMNEAYRFTPNGGSPKFKKAELLVNGAVVALGDTASGTPGNLGLNFPNVCPTGDSTAYVLRVTYGSCNNPAQEVTFQDTVFVKKTTPSLTLAKTNANCAGGGTITASITGGTGTFTYSIDGTNFQASNTFTGLASGNYTITVKNATGCTATQTTSVTLVNNLSVVALPSDTSICSGASFTPRITSAGTSYAWTPGTGVSSTTAAQPVITPTGSTQYIVTATQGPCTAKDTVNVIVFPGPQVNAGPDVVVINGDAVQLQATAATGSSYLWTPSTGLSATNILNPLASPTATTTYTLKATSPQGCVATDDVVVTVLNCINPMDAFTPNGDGINDVWLVTYSSCYKVAKVEVFNRYGNKVFQSDNYKNDWNGTYKGKPVPDGTYYFVVTYTLINGKTNYLKGNVTILR